MKLANRVLYCALAIFILFSTQLLFEISAEKKDELCLRKLGLKEEVMRPILKNIVHPLHENEDYNIFLECYWKELEYMDDKGKLLWNNIERDYEAKFDKSDILRDIISHCKNQHLRGANVGETAIKNQNCLMEGVANKHLIK